MTKFGIIGCANIAKKNIRALVLAQTLTNGKLCLSAIASRDLEKANLFVDQLRDLGVISSNHSIRIFGNYEELINDQTISAIYIPLPTTLHLQWAIKAVECGKHILLEKPSTIDCSELLQILYSCAKLNVVFMDGVMFMHHKRMQSLFKHLNDPFTGNIQKILSAFTFNGMNSDFFTNDIRTKVDGDPLGAMGDLGWYCIRLAIVVFNKGNDKLLQLKGFVWPKECKAVCNKWTVDGIPLDCEATVYFGTDDEPLNTMKKLVFDCSFCLPWRESFEILTTTSMPSSKNSVTSDKIIKCDDFVIPRNTHNCSFTIESFSQAGPLGDFDTKVMSNIQTININSEEDQEVNMFLEFHRIVQENDIKAKTYYKMISLLTQTIVDSCMMSMKLEGKSVSIDTSSVKSFLE